jgi:hypothetical protein
MATSMSTAKKVTKEDAGKAPPPASQSKGFLFIERYRVAVTISPFILAGIMISLNMFAGQRIHAVIDFLTGFSQR